MTERIYCPTSGRLYTRSEVEALQAVFRQKLKDSGFQDLENPDDPDSFIQPEIIRTNSKFAFDEAHLEFCQRVLENYNFKRDLDRAVFELHTEGRSLREIESWLHIHSYRPLKKDRIDQLIKRIKEDFRRQG